MFRDLYMCCFSISAQYCNRLKLPIYNFFGRLSLIGYLSHYLNLYFRREKFLLEMVKNDGVGYFFVRVG